MTATMVACARAPVAIETPKASGQTKESTGLPAFFQIRDQARSLDDFSMGDYGGPQGMGRGLCQSTVPLRGDVGTAMNHFH